MHKFESLNDFQDAIKEIEILVEDSDKNQSRILHYGTYNKASIVLLCGKFESFIEAFLEEYVYEIISNLSNVRLEENIKHHLTDLLITELEKKKNNKARRIDVIRKMNKLYGDEEIICNDYSIDCKFSYGKHGEGEVKKLLTRFGFEDFANSDSHKDFYNKFNSLNHLRNNILHEDKTPSLTHNDVKEHIKEINNFILALCNFGSSKLMSLSSVT